MIQYMAILIGFYLITCICGLPFQMILENDRSKAYRGITCPLYGLGIGMILMYYFNLLEFSVSQIAVLFTLFFAVTDLFILIRRRNRFFIDWKKTGIACLLIAIVTLYFAFPGVVNNEGGLPVILSNYDFAFYAAGSNGVKYHGASYLRNHFGKLPELVTGIQNRYIAFWIAYISSVFQVGIFNAVSLAAIYLYSLFVMAGAALASVFVKNKYLYVAVGICFFFNCNFQYMFYQGFLGQIASVSFIIMITVLFLWIAEAERIRVKESVSLGILAAGLAATYGEMIPIVVLPIMLTLVIALLFYRNRAKILFQNLFIAAATVGILFARGYYTSIKTLFITTNATVGWDVRPGFLLQSIGVYNVHTIDIFSHYEIPMKILFAVGCVIWIGICTYVYKKFSGEKRLLLEIYLIVYGLLYFVFLWRYDLYKTFKAMLNTSYIFITVIIICLFDKEKLSKKYQYIKTMSLAAIMILVAGGGLNVAAYDYAFSAAIEDGNHVFANVIGKDHDELAKFLEQTDYNEIYVSGTPYWDNLAALAVLTGLQVKSYDINENMWGSGNQIPGSHAVVTESSVLPDAVRFYGKTVFKNTSYIVKEPDTSYPFCLNRQSLGTAMYLGLDSDNYAIGGRKIQNQDSCLQFYVDQERNFDVYFSFLCNSENEIVITMPDGKEEKLYCKPGNNDIKFSDVFFAEGSGNLIRMRTQKTEEAYLTELAFDTRQQPDYPYHLADMKKYGIFSPQQLFEKAKKFFYKAEILDFNGTTISFSARGNYEQYIEDGLWGCEGEGLWTKDSFGLSVRIKEKKDICISWDGQAFQKDYIIRVSCNGKELGVVGVHPDHTLEDFIVVSDFLIKGENRIDFKIENIVSPAQIAQSADCRQLGIYLRHIFLRKVKTTSDGS